MTTRLRLVYLTIAVLIAVAAAIAIGRVGAGDDVAQAPQRTPTPEATAPDAGPPGDATVTPTATPRPRGPLLVAGAERTIEVAEGDTVSFRVRHDSDEELHVHGYDLSEDLPAGETVPVSFEATIPGIFEIELEGSHVLLARLEVRP